MSSKAASRTLTVVTLIVSAACFASICLYVSAHRMMWADEFDAWNLLADPSWRHAFQSLNNGADSGPPLFYAVGRCLLAIAGLHPVVVRLYSAMCFWLAAVVWAQVLRRYFGNTIGIAAVTLFFLANVEVVDQMAQVRFYGELVLATTVAVYIVLWLARTQPSVRSWFAYSALSGLVLVASHPLGLIYSAGILFAQLCTKTPLRKRIAALAGTGLSWAYLLVFFGPVKHASQTDTWLSMPNAAAVVHFYDNHPLLFGQHRYASVVLNLVLIALALYACLWFIRSEPRKSAQTGSLALLFYISAILTAMPIGFAIVSHLYKPLFLDRYLLPYDLGLSALASAGAWLLTRKFAERLPVMFAALLFIPLAMLVHIAVAEQYRDPPSNLDPLLQLAQSTSIPTVLQHDGIVRQAHFYAPSRANNLFYLMLMPKPGEHATLDSIAEQGYEPYLVFDGPFFRQHRQFLYVEGAGWPKVYQEDLVGNPQWTSRQVTTVTILGRTYPVLKFTRVAAPASALPGAH